MNHHMVSFCPGEYCRCQRTWTSYDTKVFICDHCKLQMRYDYYTQKLILI